MERESSFPVGTMINCLPVVLGGIAGALFGAKVPERIKTELTRIFGICALGMGIGAIVLMKNMPADMIPAMVLVMPISWLWTNFILPLL